jgi:hypothetical protein
MTEQQDIDRGRQAAELLESPLLKAALDAIEAEVVAQWEQCPARDTEGKEALWQLMKTSKKFRSLLTGYVNTGKLAAENLSRFEKKQTWTDRLRA